MNKSCPYCGRTHRRGEECPKKPRRDYKADTETEARRLRHSWAWARTAKAIKRRDGGVCLVCLARGAAQTSDLEVHHIVPVKDDPDRLLDESNLITLCAACHERAERGEIGKDELTELARLGVSGILRGTPRIVKSK